MMQPACRFCHESKHVKLRRRRNSNGSIAVYWYCEDCSKGAELGERSYSHKEANAFITNLRPGKTIDDLPIVADYTNEAEPCLICGERDTEFNHWLPQMFRDNPEVSPEWDTWANVGASLCRKHHAMWHRIVTPYMSGIGASRTSEP